MKSFMAMSDRGPAIWFRLCLPLLCLLSAAAAQAGTVGTPTLSPSAVTADRKSVV